MPDTLNIRELLDRVYDTMAGSEEALEFSKRHGINSAAILTVTDDETASALADYLAPRIEGKTVVEIGGGLGLLAMHLGHIAKRVYCIETNPIWASMFTAVLMRGKPRNVSYLLGAADEFVGIINADVAIYCTHSDVRGMGLVAAQFAPVVIDVYTEVIDLNPNHYDETARILRKIV